MRKRAVSRSFPDTHRSTKHTSFFSRFQPAAANVCAPIIITEGGKPSEAPLGIMTPSDLVELED